ncbi:MAG TPA: hypothetical protein PKX00_18375 [Opitutaceae bacterium]|jgi:hypothetical protein|nr:hypothetical protein [Opitutaceae bacterium]
MKTFVYLSLLPEALVASHLNPDEYGAYLAVGTKKRSRGQALYFKLSDDYAGAKLRELSVDPELDRGDSQPPRRSRYLGIYRALEHTPVEVLESLHLATEDGRVLTLRAGDYKPDPGPRYHLYQEFCPVTPRVVSELEPREFGARITDATQPVSLPALAFAELRLERLGEDPEADGVDNLPYPNLEHLRDCIRELRLKQGKSTKTVIRTFQQDVLFRTILGGFYVASTGGGFRFFPMPSREDLETRYYPWWRSALSTFGA